MADIEKVIKGLDCHISDPDGYLNCNECPYHYHDFSNSVGCLNRLHIDASELLKSQPQIVRCKDCRWWHESKLEQFKGFGECWQANGIVLKPHDWFCADGECKDE